MKKDDMTKKIVENVNSPPAVEKTPGRTRRIFSRTRKASRKRLRIAWSGLRNFALDARAISI